MKEIVLQGKTRSVIGKQVRTLRREGWLPAVIYGHNITPLPISLNYHESVRVLQGISSSQLIVIEVDGHKHTVLVREKQHQPVHGAYLHIDFQEVSMTEKLRTTVGIVFEGVSPAVKEISAIMVPQLEELEIECLPRDLPERVVVDISGLKSIGDSISVRDLQLPEKVTVLTEPNELVVVITPPQAVEEVVEAPAAEEIAAEPEVIERGKKEEVVEEE